MKLHRWLSAASIFLFVGGFLAQADPAVDATHNGRPVPPYTASMRTRDTVLRNENVQSNQLRQEQKQYHVYEAHLSKLRARRLARERAARLGRERAVAAATARAAATPTPATPGPASIGTGGMSAFEACVIRVESGGNPRAVNASSGAGGLFQFLPSTWASLGFAAQYPGGAQTAPVSVQEAAFAKLYAEAGTAPWAPYDGC
jgi:hypothetical protein